MTQLRALLVILALCLSAAALAQDSVSREAWSALVLNMLPELLCHDESYFVQCFGMDTDQCESDLAKQTRNCLENLSEQIPSRISTSEQGRVAGELIGRCAGARFDLFNQERKIDSPPCNDPAHWAEQ